ncbi:MAG: NUDIX hydrolase [Candidatus Pseudobacter hemicellulosilyticus]|uniref:GDP-mannose pyrophosphatase n=1 Tax=Candidatus Pseudobacter hemicellulosilyticus TaxID=3121375 RepID=A0AAJ5WSC3_9BACT|nr:MAG: NUDIX hydrolase [Pseudobacter sp.]
MIDEQQNPWQIVSAQEIYTNPWIALTEYQVINPSGGKGIYGKVHFRNLAVGVLPLDQDLNTYLVGQYRFTLDRYSWEIPEGGCPENTDPLLSAQRELLEETGLVAARWEPLAELHLSNSVTDEYGIVYLARQLEQGTAEPEETEQLQVKKLPFAEVYQMMEKGIITDSLSVAAILKVKIMLADGRIS